MKLKIIVCFLAENDNSEKRLAELQFVERQEGRYTSVTLPESVVQLPDGSKVTIFGRFSQQNTGTHLTVMREGKQLAIMLTPWGQCNPYLGLQIGNVGILHLYCEKE